MSTGVGEVLIVSLRTGEYEVADRYALVERGMPDGYEAAEGLGRGDWLDAIARAAGREPLGLSDANGDYVVLADLRSGASVAIHKAAFGEYGPGEGWTRLDEADTLDLLDALRAARGLDPCERPGAGDPTARSP